MSFHDDDSSLDHGGPLLGLADISIVAFGAVALLLVLFFTIAAARIRDSEHCNPASESEIRDVSIKVRSWYEGERGENDRLAAIREKRCGTNKTDKWPKSESEIQPTFLARFCPSTRAQILQRAGITDNQLSDVQTRRSGLLSDVTSCLAPQTVTCRSPDELGGTSKLAGQLKEWYQEEGLELKLARARLTLLCPQEKPPAVPVSALRFVPPPLVELCPEHRNGALSASGLSQAEIDIVEAEIALLRRTIQTCAPIPVAQQCISPQGAARTSVVRGIGAWTNARRNLSDKLDRLSRACDVAIGPSKDSETDSDVVGPQGLRDVCPNEKESLLKEAGVSATQFDELRRSERRVLNIARHCNVADAELVTRPTQQVQFFPCEARISEPAANLGKYFEELAGNVVAAMKGKTYNRIDIFGHSDARSSLRCLDETNKTGEALTIVTRAKQALITDIARTNEGLSVHRTITFRKLLIEALHHLTDPDAQALANKIDGSEVRVYAIGVGADDPLISENNEEAWRKNRRTEIRFATENRSGAAR